MSKYGTKQIKLGRGRPTAEEVTIRQTLQSWLEIEDMVGKDVSSAYEVLREIMLDKTASAAQREKAATKILELHARFYKTRVKNLDGVSDEESEDEEETSVVFQWKQAN